MSNNNLEAAASEEIRRVARVEEVDRDLTPVYIGGDRRLADALTCVVHRWARKPAAPGGRLQHLPEIFEYGIRIDEDDVGADNFQRLIGYICRNVRTGKLDGPYIYEDSSWALSQRSLIRLIDNDPLAEASFDEFVHEYTLDELAEAIEHATQLGPGQKYDFLVTALDRSGSRFVSAIMDDEIGKVMFWPFLRSSFTDQSSAKSDSASHDTERSGQDDQQTTTETEGMEGKSKVERRVYAIAERANELFDDPLSIPSGGKKKLRDDLCNRYKKLFTISTFDSAWKKAKKENLVEVENVEQYKKPK